MSSIILYHHLGLGDHIICHGIVREYCKKYEKVAIFSKPHNYASVSFMFSDLKNLTILKGDDVFAKKFIFLNKFKLWRFRYNKIKIVGFKFLNNKSNLTFEQQFYKIADVDFAKKWENFYIPRNLEKELDFLKKVTPSNGYVFVHEDNARNYTINREKIGSKFPIFTPQTKFTNNIFDYCTIIEKATEIHVIDSSFMFLIDCLQYENPEQKIFVHRYARRFRKVEDDWTLPILKKNWNIIAK